MVLMVFWGIIGIFVVLMIGFEFVDIILVMKGFCKVFVFFVLLVFNLFIVYRFL